MVQNIEVTGIGPVTIARRKGMRSIRISVSQNGTVRLSLPYGVSMQKGLEFLQSKKDWLQKHATEPHSLDDGAIIGTGTVLRLHTGSGTRVKTILKGSELHVYIPDDMLHDQLQKKLQNITKKQLLQQAQVLLPILKSRAKQAGYKLNGSKISLLKSRWGSCSSDNHIVLNGYLMQLPSIYIDYVIWHELAHTKHHDHSVKFWTEVSKYVPNYKMVRKQLKKYPTSVFDRREFESVM